MGKKSNGLYLALQHIEKGHWIKPTWELCQQLFWSAMLPVVLTLTTLAFGLKFYLWLRLRFFSSARELHHEALCVYQLQKNNTKKKQSTVHHLLQRAIQRDPTYQPAYLSLAACYLYPPFSNKRDADRALEVLTRCRSHTRGSEEIIRALMLDCQAIQSGQEQMILDILRQDEYLNRAFAMNRQGKSSTLNSANSLSSTHGIDERKKDK